MRTYKGYITHLEPHQVALCGTNTQGRHGQGAALWCLKNAGAIYGQAEGLMGQTWGLITKDLTLPVQPSVSRMRILTGIIKAYDYFLMNSQLECVVLYDSVGPYRNGYTPMQMAENFYSLLIPDNFCFEEGFAKLLMELNEKVG